ncbi:MAG TPA: DNA polymerase III subunit delta [Arachidicoccus sp.]|nr:DNA polymerase III subunit delta [Arachidicoccus sp.]
MSVEKIIDDWKKRSFKPIYWLEGEESYYIDQVMDYAEHHLLTEAEAGFNLSIFYGRDAAWAEVANACKRFPMFAERQVVLLKEAQFMKDILKLESYFEKPQPSTVLVVSYKDKKLDARTKLSKTLKKIGEVLSTKKIYDNQLPQWVTQRVQQRGFSITPKAVLMIAEHIGNDLGRIDNEITKLIVNLSEKGQITEDDIETYIGISKEFNVFELQRAVAAKDLPRVLLMIQYFDKNPKAAPIQVILPTLYNFFSKASMVFGAGSNEAAIASALGVHPFFAKDYMAAARLYGPSPIDKILLLLHHYNLKSVGIDNGGATDTDLLKEMMVKIMAQA